MSTNIITLLSSISTEEDVKDLLNTMGLPDVGNKDAGLELALRFSDQNQATVSAMVINLTKGQVDNPTLTSILRAQFPDNTIDDQRGAYHMSKARSGKLRGCHFTPPTKHQPKEVTAEDVLSMVARLSPEERAKLIKALA